MKSIQSITFILLFITQLVFAQSKREKLEQLFEFYDQQNLFNGAVFISEKGETLLNKGYGLSNVDLKKENNANSIFQIYSITKTFTAKKQPTTAKGFVAVLSTNNDGFALFKSSAFYKNTFNFPIYSAAAFARCTFINYFIISFYIVDRYNWV